MKHEWRKHEKDIYIPKKNPICLTIPTFSYYCIEGKGDPNDLLFGEKVAALYGMSYGIRMMPKKGATPPGYFEYTVYPLEGIWTLAKEDVQADGSFNKKDLLYKLMIRQPEFVTMELAMANQAEVSQKKANIHNRDVTFEQIDDGLVIQMLHEGSFDTEPETFAIMSEYATINGLTRTTMAHREIYLSDPRKVTPDKLKTVLRMFVK